MHTYRSDSLMKISSFYYALAVIDDGERCSLAQEPANADMQRADITQETSQVPENRRFWQSQRLKSMTPPVPFEPQVRYVSDEFFVPLRETPCPRCKIVHWGIKSGVAVDLLDLA